MDVIRKLYENFIITQHFRRTRPANIDQEQKRLKVNKKKNALGLYRTAPGPGPQTGIRISKPIFH